MDTKQNIIKDKSTIDPDKSWDIVLPSKHIYQLDMTTKISQIPTYKIKENLSLTNKLFDSDSSDHYIFYVGFDKGIINNSIENHNKNIVLLDNWYCIKFIKECFVSIDIKIISDTKRTIFLIRDHEMMVDQGDNICINMKWTGVVYKNTTFLLSGVCKNTSSGYWNIKVI